MDLAEGREGSSRCFVAELGLRLGIGSGGNILRSKSHLKDIFKGKYLIFIFREIFKEFILT